MGDHHLKGRLLKFITLNHLFQPLGLFGTVIVKSYDATVFNVVVRLVLTTVEHDKADGALPEHII